MNIDFDPTTEQDGQLDEILGAYFEAVASGKSPDLAALIEQHPDLAPQLTAFFSDQDRIQDIIESGHQGQTDSSGEIDLGITLPLCGDPGEAIPRGEFGAAADCGCGSADEHLPDAGCTLGEYHLLERIGTGGMGTVYRAQDRRLGRVVALKAIKAGKLATPQDVLRFRMEADMIAQLDHPHIVTIYDVDQHLGQLFFSMKLMEGGSLANEVGRYVDDPRAAARVMVEIARAVHYMHQRGILHRDLKPSNILLDREGRPHVSDFGLAKRVDQSADLSFSGELIGTPEFMAPEQASGIRGATTVATDVHGLGAVMYSLLTGRPPFKVRGCTLLETLEQVRDRVPPSPRGLNPKVDRDLATICLKCLEKEPSRRYGSAEAVARALERWLSGERIDCQPPGPFEQLRLWARPRPAVAALSAALALTIGLALGVIAWQSHRMRANEAEALVNTLVTARAEAVPDLVRALGTYRALARPRLRGLLESGTLSAEPLARVGMALLPEDHRLVGDLAGRMLEADSGELDNLRRALWPRREGLREGLWAVVADLKADETRRLRAACALAELDPGAAVRWGRHGPDIVERLMVEPLTTVLNWAELLRPVRHHLLGALRAAFEGREGPEHRQAAALVLGGYVDEPGLLAALIETADAKQLEVLIRRLPQVSDAIPLLEATLSRRGAADPAGADRPESTCRHANAAVGLLAMGRGERVWPLLRHEAEPRLRPELIHRIGPAGIDPELLIERLAIEPEPSARQALILALGDYPTHRLSRGRRDQVVPGLLRAYRDDPDPGLHSSAEWLLRRWGCDDRLASSREGLVSEEPLGGRSWYISRAGQTMLVVADPKPFMMGSPTADPKTLEVERRPERRTPAPYAIAATEVTVAQFLRFTPDHPYDRTISQTDDSPINQVDYFDALKYCRRLSEAARIPEDQMCYPRVQEIGPKMRLPPDYLRRTGYRLPTEEEWEYACRAGTQGYRYSGPSEDLVPNYEWLHGTARGHAWPVGLLKPNDLGLFDMLGNVSEWCHLSYTPRQPCDTDLAPRVYRGTRYNQWPVDARSSERLETLSHRWITFGFRVATTIRRSPLVETPAGPPGRARSTFDRPLPSLLARGTGPEAARRGTFRSLLP